MHIKTFDANTTDESKPKKRPQCPMCKNYWYPTLHNCLTNNPGNVDLLYSLYTKVEFRCKFVTEGCPTVARGWEVRVHERVCDFGPWLCPLRGRFQCTWEDKKELMLEHLYNEHRNNLLFKNTVKLTGRKSSGYCPDDASFVLRKYNSIFRLTMFYEVASKLLHVMVHHYPNNAFEKELFKFEVHFLDENKRSLLNFAGRCQAISDDNLKRVTRAHITIHRDSIKAYTHGMEDVNIIVKVRKVMNDIF